MIYKCYLPHCKQYKEKIGEEDESNGEGGKEQKKGEEGEREGYYEFCPLQVMSQCFARIKEIMKRNLLKDNILQGTKDR